MAAILCPLSPVTSDLALTLTSFLFFLTKLSAPCCIQGFQEKDGETEGGRVKRRGGRSRIVVFGFVSFPAPVRGQVHKASVHVVQAAEAR